MKLNLYFVFLCLFVLTNNCDSARILGVFPTPSHSHQIVFSRLTNALAQRGHNVTVLTTDILKDAHPNLKQIDLSASYKLFKEILDFGQFQYWTGPYLFFHVMFDAIVKIPEEQLQHPEVQKLIHDKNEHFDLVIVELVGYSSMYAFAEHFKAPLLGITSVGTVANTHDVMGNPCHPVLNPDLFLSFDQATTFFQRVHSFLHLLYVRSYIKYFVDVQHDIVIKKVFGPNASKSEDLKKNIDLVIMNSNPVFDHVRPVVPATILVNGLHIYPSKPLPEKLETFLNKSRNGVIYFSFGSNMKSELLGQNLIKMFIEAFKGLKYNVVWKWESDTLDDKPDNVYVAKWLPQQDLLAHRNIKAFITQGGQQSVEESIDRHVPMMVVPFFADQFPTAEKLVNHGIAIKHLVADLNVEKIQNTITELIENKMYKQKIVKLDNLMKDNPMSSLDRGIWWTEYLLRHKTAKHIQYEGVNMSWFKYYCIDVCIFLFIVFLILSLVVVKFFEWLNVICKRESRNGKKME